MSWADLAVVVIIGFSALLSLWRGTLREVLSLAVWLIAFGVGFLLMEPIMAALEPRVDVVSVRAIIGFGGAFLATLVVGGLINIIIVQVARRRRPSTPDRLLGSLFGLLRGACAVLLLVLLASFTSLPRDDWWQASLVLRQMDPVTGWLHGLMPVQLPPPPDPAAPPVPTATS